MINDHKTQGEWNINLTIVINYFSSKDSEKICTKSDNIEISIGNETDEIIENLFDFLLKRHQKGLEESMKGSKC